MDNINLGDNVILVKCQKDDDNFQRLIEFAKEKDNEFQTRKIIITRQEPQTKGGKFVLYVHGPRGDQLMRLTQFNGDEMDIIFKTLDEHNKQMGGSQKSYYDKYQKYKSKYLRLRSNK